MNANVIKIILAASTLLPVLIPDAEAFVDALRDGGHDAAGIKSDLQLLDKLLTDIIGAL